MIFLNPAVLFGLIAAAIPVLLHFLNLQKLKKIEFSTLTFLKQLQKTKIRKLKFKQWLLLALRMLIIMLLVSAFARPTLESVNIGGTSAAKTTSVFIIDNSYSMSYVSGGGSLFNKSKQIVKNLLSQMEEGDEAVILYTSGIDKIIKPTGNFDKLIGGLNLENISLIKSDYKSVFSKASEILTASDNYNKELYFFSDYQDLLNSLNSSGSSYNFDTNTKIYLFDFPVNGINNVTLSKFDVENQIFEKGKPVGFNAVVSDYTGNAVSNKVVSLFMNEVRSARQSFSLNPSESNSLKFEANLKENGLVETMTEVEDDDITADNKRYNAFYVPEKINVLLLSDNPEDNRFVKLALSSSGTDETINLKEENLSRLTPSLLNGNDVVIIIGSKNISNVNALRTYIESGGKTIIFPGSSSTLGDFQKLTTGLGLPAAVSQIGEINNTTSPVYFDNVEYNHPLFVNLFKDRKDTKVESPEIYSYFKIVAGAGGKPVITMTDNSFFLSEYNPGKGDVLLFNTAPLLSWNTFPVKSLFAPLINKMTMYQAVQNDLGSDIYAGDEISIRLGNLSMPVVKVVRPDKSEDFININELENNRILNYNKTNDIGIYKFYGGEKLINFASVNFDPAESDSKYLSEDEMKNIFDEIIPDNEYMIIDPAADYNQTIRQARFGTELWKYFLLAAFFIALIEMFVSKSSKKDLTEIK